MGIITIHTTYKNAKDAKGTIELLLKHKLIACANISPIKSIYRWEQKIRHEDEVELVVKTTSDKWKKVRDTINKMHPYEIPSILRLPVKANKEYERWVRQETQ